MIIDNGDGTFSIKMPPPWKKQQPLSDEEITNLWRNCWNEIEFARAIEKAHGIE